MAIVVVVGSREQLWEFVVYMISIGVDPGAETIAQRRTRMQQMVDELAESARRSLWAFAPVMRAASAQMTRDLGASARKV